MSTPYTIGINKELIDEFHDKFDDELNEHLFMFMTEATPWNGVKYGRTLVEACEDIVLAVKGISREDWENENGVDYDEIGMEARDFVIEMLRALLRKSAEEY